MITLSNGKKVENFSSPHPFVFTDGSILPGKNASYAELMKVIFTEEDMGRGDVKLTFSLPEHVMGVVLDWQRKYEAMEIDVVFIPLPMLYALKERGYNIKNSPFRTIRIEDRINKKVSITKQCL